jgi:hypothetical protein
VIVRYGNEPNHQGWTAQRYAAVLKHVAGQLRVEFPGAPLMMANLCLDPEEKDDAGNVTKPHWTVYWQALQDAGALDVVDWVGMSLYRDDATDLSRIQPYINCGKPLAAVEWGVDYERDERRIDWLRWSAGILKTVDVLLAFLPHGDPGPEGWGVHLYNDIERAGLAAYLREARDRPFVEATR